MSMMKTLAKVAIGVAVAKGASSMMKRSSAGQSDSPRAEERRGSGGGGLFGGAYSPQPQRQTHSQAQGGSLEDMLGDLLSNQGQSGGGLGGLLDQLGGTPGTPAEAQRGGVNDLLAGVDETAERARAEKPDDLGGLLGGLISAASGGAAARAQPKGGFGDMLNQAIARQDEPEHAPTARQEAAAGLMLRAMIQAAKSDGRIDRDEEEKLLGRLGTVSDEERTFVQEELARRVDVRGLARAVPRGMEQQLYAMSVMGIDLDSQAEAQYLHDLAQEMGLQPRVINHIHDQLGVPPLYS